MILSRPRRLGDPTGVLADDPLTYYEQTIALSKQGNKGFQHAFRLLETAVLRYQSDFRYQNSPRYIRLWLMYIFYLPSSMAYPILFGLIEKHIGDKLSVLYESIAYQQFRDKRYKDIEATLLLGIKRRAQPLKRLGHDLYEYQTTGRIQFDINHYKLDNFYDSMLIDQKLINIDDTLNDQKHRYSLHTLRSQMDLLYLKLQHSARADLLRGCNSIKPLQQQQEQEEICFEELRAKLYQYRFDYSKLNIDQQYITTGSPTSAVTATSKPRMVKRASKPSILVCRANKKNILLTNKSKERKSLGRHPTIAKHTLGSTALQHPHRKSMGITDSRHKRLTAAFQKINKLDTFEKHSSNGMTLKNAMLMVEEKEEEEKEGQDGTLLSTQPEKVKELGSYQVSHRQQAKESEAQVVSDVQRPSTSFKLINDELIGRKGQRQDIQKPFSEHPLDLDGKKSVRRETPTMVPLPHSPQFVRERMERYNLYRHKAFHDYRDENNKSLTTDRLKQWFPPPSTSAGMKALSSSTLAQHQHLRLIDLGERQFHVIRKIGEGGMANVYLVQNTKDLTIHSLKIQQPPHAWEFYIVYQLYHRKKHRERIQANKSRGSGSSTHSATTGAYDGGGAHSRLNLLLINEFFYYKNASFLLMEYIPYGTLLDALNLYRPSQIFMPEPIVLLFMSQLLSQLVHLHQLHIVHNDLKLDNVLLLSTYKNRHDKNRGNKQTRLPTLYLIDYGQSIDVLALLNKSQMMTNSGHKHNLLVKANWPPTCPKADFPYLNEGYYPFHADYWQLAAMAHWLLFGSPMRTYKKKTDCSLNAFVLYQSIKRYWHKHLWARFFHLLLNPSMAETQDASTVLLQQLADEFWTAGKDVDLSLISAFNDLLLYRQR